MRVATTTALVALALVADLAAAQPHPPRLAQRDGHLELPRAVGPKA